MERYDRQLKEETYQYHSAASNPQREEKMRITAYFFKGYAAGNTIYKAYAEKHNSC